VSVLLNRSTGVTIVRAMAAGTILDDDGPATITIVSGDNQSTVINTAFDDLLAFVVKNAAGQPVQGAMVSFAVPAAGPGGYFSVPIAAAIYNQAADQVALVPTKYPRANQQLRLTITASGTLDALGRPLDGNHDGLPGGDFQLIFKGNRICVPMNSSASRTSGPFGTRV